MLEIAFFLAVLIYFHFESLTEQFTWKRGIKTRTYHQWRVMENIGALAGVILFSYIQNYWILLLSITAGLSWYEILWNIRMYENIWHQKDGYWICGKGKFIIKIKHPKGWIWVLLLIISVGTIVLILK